jgi:cytidine deaminase
MSEVGPELIIGLVGALGTDLKAVERCLEQELSSVNYQNSLVRLSDLLLDCEKYSPHKSLSSGPEDARIEQLMNDGDDFRRTSGRSDALILLAISRIRDIRTKAGQPGKPLSRHAILLHSLKHPQEIERLREVYGDTFVAISVYTPKAERRKMLLDRFGRSRKAFNQEAFTEKADELIERDEKAVGEDWGQNVRDTFPLADIFFEIENSDTLHSQVKRFVEIFFHHPNRTPTIDEYGLFHAKAAALRSADLSRQVGAVITSAYGEIIAAGCNEVPRAGGGAFWEGQIEKDVKDRRDFIVGHDANAEIKHELLSEMFSRLKTGGWLSDEVAKAESSTLVDKALHGPKAVLAGTRVSSIVEFGRIVHAEMNAITEAARRGTSIKGSTLYCTTFPCHMCARHILSAGIKRVVYVEPYPKSLAKKLYKGSLDVDHDPEADADAVIFRPFVGVSPRRYIDFFEMPLRKNQQGFALQWSPIDAVPRVRQFPTYLDVEAALVEQLADHQIEWGLRESKL